MTKQDAISLISNEYDTEPDYPFKDDMVDVVFRHCMSRKWFALLMDVPESCLGLNSDKTISILNLKIPVNMIEDVRMEDGIYPAYHMNKRHWISVDLRKMNRKKLEILVKISFNATAMKKDISKKGC